MFNTLKYAKKLEEVGLTRDQAEAHIQIMTEIIETNLATKQDIQDLRGEFHKEFALARMEMGQMRSELEYENRQTRSELEHKMLQLESRLTIKLGSIVSIAIGVAVTITKLLG